MEEENAKPKFLMVISRTEALLGMLACISVILILMPKHWISKTMEIYPHDYKITIGSDSYSGGNSIARWVDEGQQIWECELHNQFSTPYCSMQVALIDEHWRGLNLKEFNDMTIWLDYEGPGDHVRVYLRNRHPDYFIMGDDTTTKYNFVEIPINDLNTGLTVHMSDFGVADWWLAQKKIPLKNSHSQFNDVVFLEIQTGSQSFSGTHRYKLKKVMWRGNLMPEEALYRGIVLFWSIFIFILLLVRVIHLKMELSRNQRHQEELRSINKLLNLQNKQFEDLAKSDPLTGLLNRIGIRDALYEGLNDWKSHRKPFSFVLVDIDHFKKVNDAHGHDVGDIILKGTAELFQENVRRSDFLARWGGEEFILVCPDTNLEQAHIVAELLRKKLEQAEMSDGIKVTASFGVSTLSQPDLDILFKNADLALYDAKNLGRNKVICRS